MSGPCTQCPRPEACSARRECERREAGEVRAAYPICDKNADSAQPIPPAEDAGP